MRALVHGARDSADGVVAPSAEAGSDLGDRPTQHAGPSSPEVRRDLLVVALAGAALVLPIVLVQLTGGTVFGWNDMTQHVERSQAFELWPFHPPVPNFLTHLLFRLTDLATGGASAELAAGIVTVAARAATAALIYLVVRGFLDDTGPRLGRAAGIATTIAVLVAESPRILVHGVDMTEGGAFMPIQYMMGPTGIVFLPLAVLLPPLLIDFVRRAGSGRLTLAFGGLTVGVLVVGALAKPSLVQALLPVLPFWAAWFAHRSDLDVRRATTAVVLILVPASVAVLAWELWWLDNGMLGEADQHQVVWGPLEAIRATGITLFGAIAFTVLLVGVIVGGRSWLRNPKVALLLGGMVVGLAQVFLLVETNGRANHGNIGKAAQICFFLLVVEAFRWFASRLEERDRRPVENARLAVAGVIVLLTVSSGVIALAADGWPG